MGWGIKLGEDAVELVGWAKTIYWEKDSIYDKYIHLYITGDAQAIAHHSSTDAQLAPQAAEERVMNSHPLLNSFCLILYGMEYPFGR